ncbi:MAG TPA: anthranilate synthase component I family protein [Cytophagaceae bacterium]|nr:anthranilate synthase component I family protein [Cytophagaceae bacterium]
MRKTFSFLPEPGFVDKALSFADQYLHAVYLNPNDYRYPHKAFLHVLAFGTYKELQAQPENNFDALKKFLDQNRDWTFGYFSYDLKNEIELLQSNHEDLIGFAPISFFVPEHLIFFEKEKIIIQSYDDPEKIYQAINRQNIDLSPISAITGLQQKISREAYIEKINLIRKHIKEGDLYEINFCMEYFGRGVKLSPLAVYQKLNKISPMPFSSYVKIREHYLIGASPERFLKKEKQKIISQPIKGTAKRELNPEKDELVKTALENNPKERAENVMIVDLVRNDLSRSAVAGSVQAEELCKVYTFPKVHQMISTIVAELPVSVHPIDMIRDAFPMGSMTGAPKVRAMELIEQYEESKRGLFSGAVGYFSPEMDFDFNVVIRSLLYNQAACTLSFQVGSAITYSSSAEMEYEECAVKTAAIREVLNG